MCGVTPNNSHRSQAASLITSSPEKDSDINQDARLHGKLLFLCVDNQNVIGLFL